MKKILAVILVLFSVNAFAGSWTGNANLFLGQKKLNKNDWDPADKQAEAGLLFDFRPVEWPVSIAIDLLASEDKVTVAGLKIKASTTEADLGLRKIWEISGSSIRPYIGGGVAFVNAKLKERNTNVSIDDNGTGYWLDGGAYWTFNESFNLGLELRYSNADVTLLGSNVKAGGTHAGVVLGYHW
jgi:hypothetical protein